MHGVVRFEDIELLPASAPEDYPKVIRTGIDEEGQHRKSPAITGPCGVATLFYRLSRPELLERLLDVDGTYAFDFEMHLKATGFQDSYITRRGRTVEIGFISKATDRSPKRAQHGVRYDIQDVDPLLPYKIGAWKPISTSDLDSEWGGTDVWIRAQGAALAKGIWWNKHWEGESITTLAWTGMTDEQRASLDAWRSEFAVNSKTASDAGSARYEQEKQADKAAGNELGYLERMMALHRRLQQRCRNDCGVEECTTQCSQCKTTKYCSVKCQQEDWKYHKSICGAEEGY